jgi:hypothetical protein
VFGVPANVPKIVAPFIDHFHKEHARRKITFKHIYNEDARDRIKYLNSLPYCEAAYLPEKFNSPVSTFVCGPEIAIVKWEPLIFIRIVDETFARAYENYFYKLYEEAKKK